MAQRKQREAGLIDGLTAELGGPRTAKLLGRLDAVVPWTRMAAPVLALPEYQPGPGRPAWPAVTMLKCLMLAKWFGLSDPQLEETLQDRLYRDHTSIKYSLVKLSSLTPLPYQ